MSTVCFLLCIGLIYNIQGRNFYPYSYDEIILKLERWQSEHPNIFKLYTAKEKYNLYLPDHIECSKRYGKCEHHIIIITNHETWDVSPSRPHVFFSGALHGNERVGPTTLIELCDYLLFEYNNNKQNVWINYLINNRVIILTPMTNSIGYALSRREEYIKLDPNRDFPYMIDAPSECMKTIVGRTVNEIFREYLIQIAITFHGGMRAISFEWGAPNHNKPNDYSPDHIAQLELVQQMQFLGGHLPSNSVVKGRNNRNNNNKYNNNNIFSKWYYPIGTLNRVVYPVRGGMEDWAYGGSWDKQSVKPCQPKTYIDGKDNVGIYPKEKTIYNDAQLRAFNFLVEASDKKIPSGNWGNIKNDWDDIWDIDNIEFDGHIPRNLRISMFVINSVQPYVLIQKYPNIIPWHPVKSVFMDGIINTRIKQKTKLIHWFVSGVMSIYQYDLLFAMKTNDDSNIKWETLEFRKNAMWRKNLDLRIDHDQKGKTYKFSIDIETKLTVDLMKQIVTKCERMNNVITMKEGKRYCPIWFSIKVKVDDQWKINRDLSNYQIIKTYPEGMGPQSHVVNARNMNESEWNMTNNKYSVKSAKWWYAIKPIKMDIYFIYDDKDNEIGTQYFDVDSDKDNNFINGDGETFIIHEKGNVMSLMSLQFLAVFLCLIGIVVFVVFYKKRSKDTTRRRHGNKTYQRLSNISIV